MARGGGAVLAAILAAGLSAAVAQPAQPLPAPYMMSPQACQGMVPPVCVGCPTTQARAVQAAGDTAARRVGPGPMAVNLKPYDLLLRGGRLIDAKNNINDVMRLHRHGWHEDDGRHQPSVRVDGA